MSIQTLFSHTKHEDVLGIHLSLTSKSSILSLSFGFRLNYPFRQTDMSVLQDVRMCNQGSLRSKTAVICEQEEEIDSGLCW